MTPRLPPNLYFTWYLFNSENYVGSMAVVEYVFCWVWCQLQMLSFKWCMWAGSYHVVEWWWLWYCTPCWLRGCKNRPALFPGRML